MLQSALDMRLLILVMVLVVLVFHDAISDSDILITEEQPNLLQCLACHVSHAFDEQAVKLTFCLWEEEIRHDGVASVRSDIDKEVFPTKLGKPVRSDLSDDDIVEPVGGGRDGGTKGPLVHREDF